MNKQKKSQKQKYFWNMAGSLCNALSTVILLLLVNRMLGNEMGGIFSFAYANAQMMMILGGFEVRPVQSTDVCEKYSFQTYFTLRIITCACMMCVCIAYVYIAGFDKEKNKIVIAFSIFKMVEAFADVFGGMFQQNDRIDLTGKVFSARVLLSTLIFGITIFITKNLYYSALAMTAASFFLIFIYDLRISRQISCCQTAICFEKMTSLIKEVFPLFVAAFILSYINNAPKYAINAYCTDVLQNKYTILFMPAFVINLFSIFYFRPALVEMAKRWNQYDMNGVICYIKKSVCFIMAATTVCIVGGVTVGLFLLAKIYAVDLSGERIVMLMVLMYGGFSALSSYCYSVIVAMRAQRRILAGYICSFVLISILSPALVKNLELLGAVMSSLIAVVVLDVIFIIIILEAIYRHRKESMNEG